MQQNCEMNDPAGTADNVLLYEESFITDVNASTSKEVDGQDVPWMLFKQTTSGQLYHCRQSPAFSNHVAQSILVRRRSSLKEVVNLTDIVFVLWGIE